jgi:hypothetical protein
MKKNMKKPEKIVSQNALFRHEAIYNREIKGQTIKNINNGKPEISTYP